MNKCNNCINNIDYTYILFTHFYYNINKSNKTIVFTKLLKLWMRTQNIIW